MNNERSNWKVDKVTLTYTYENNLSDSLDMDTKGVDKELVREALRAALDAYNSVMKAGK